MEPQWPKPDIEFFSNFDGKGEDCCFLGIQNKVINASQINSTSSRETRNLVLYLTEAYSLAWRF